MALANTFVRNLDRALYHRLRVVCLQKGITAGQAVNEAIEAWLEKQAETAVK